MVSVDDKGRCRVYIKFLLTFKSLFDQSVDQFLIFEASVKIGRVQSAEFSDPGKLAEGVLAAAPIGLLLEQNVDESEIAFGRCTPGHDSCEKSQLVEGEVAVNQFQFARIDIIFFDFWQNFSVKLSAVRAGQR